VELPVVAQTLDLAAGPQIRNVATLDGNVSQRTLPGTALRRLPRGDVTQITAALRVRQNYGLREASTIARAWVIIIDHTHRLPKR
jgi:CO/xanthine dehydrogenase FAD-binding subunit